MEIESVHEEGPSAGPQRLLTQRHAVPAHGPSDRADAPNGASLARGGLLVRNSAINLVGQAIPVGVAIVTIPFLIHGMGIERFGFLTLAWMTIGYLSLFDLGLGRALTQVVAERIETTDIRVTSRIVWSALCLSLLFGTIGAIAAGALSDSLLTSVLKLPDSLAGEARAAFLLLAASIPVVIVTAALGGVLAALQRFDILNAIRMPLGVFNYVAPLVVLQFTTSLTWITAALVSGRVCAAVAHLVMCLRAMPALRVHRKPSLALIRPLFSFGAWITVSNIISPLMVYLDRLVIGAMLAVSAVAYYATPYELVNKLLILPVAILSVLYPAFAAVHAVDRERTASLFGRGIKAVGVLLFPVVLITVAFAHEGLSAWLGSDFSRHAAPVLQCLATGVLINAFAQVASTLVQGVGRPALTAKLHLVELPIYLPMLWFAVDGFGITGAAVAWTLRALVDGVLLFAISASLLNAPHRIASLSLGMALAVGLVALPAAFDSVLVRTFIVGTLLLAFVPATWRWVLSHADRTEALRLLDQVRGARGPAPARAAAR